MSSSSSASSTAMSSKSESRSKAALTAFRSDDIGMAPEEEEMKDLQTGTMTESKDEPKVIKRLTNESVLKQTFELLEANTTMGATVTEVKDAKGEVQAAYLSSMQKTFVVDSMDDAETINKWNSYFKRDSSTEAMPLWLACVSTRRTYQTPFPGERSLLPNKAECMRMRFDQRDYTVRLQDLCLNQRDYDYAMDLTLDAEAWSKQFPDIPISREDAHIVVTNINLTSSSTLGLHVPCKVEFLTSTSQAGELRAWHKRKWEKTAGTYGEIQHLVLEPGHEFKAYSDCTLFGGDLERLCNPWLARLLTFDFEKFKETVKRHVIKGTDEQYLRVAAPELGTDPAKEPSKMKALEWFVFTFWRYLQWFTMESLALDESSGRYSAELGSYKTIQQKKDMSYTFVVAHKAMNHVIDTLKEKVQAAKVLAKLNVVRLRLSFVGGREQAQAIMDRMAIQARSRDDLEWNPFVNVSASVDLEYVSVPKHYPDLERQTAIAIGPDLIRIVAPPIRLPSEAPPLKAMSKEEGKDMAGKAKHYGRHSARTSFRNSHFSRRC